MAADTDYGIDIQMFVGRAGPPDLDPYFNEITGPDAVAQVVGLRCFTPRAETAGYLVGAEEDGMFLPDFLQGTLTDRKLFTARTLVAGEARKDERVESVTVNTSADLATQKMQVEISGTTADGPFDLTLGVDSLTVELLEQD